jgi:flagellar hook protein FlgE
MDPISIARGGLMAASARFEASASRTARMGATDPAADDVDLGQEVVEQVEAKHQFSANLGVIRIADQMWQALLDIQKD